jgi:hypothetical protein
VVHLIGDRRARDERGQIVLLIGFILAVLFVALALILNSAIYAENLATRSQTAAGDGPIEVRTDVERGTAWSLAYVNAHSRAASGAVTDNLTSAVDDYSGIAGRQATLDGRLMNVSVESIEMGSRLVQANASRNLTSRDGTANWTLASGVQVRSLVFEIEDNRTTTASCSPGGECFQLHATAGGDVWQMAVYENSTDIVVEVVGTDGTTTTCSPPPEGSASASIDLAAGTVDGHPCPAVRTGVPPPPYDLEIAHGDLAIGTFEVIVDDETVATSPDSSRYFGPGSSDSPRVTHAAYATDVRITQRGDRIVYNGTVRVAPGEWP